MDDALAEKRLFTEQGETTDLFVAADLGVVRVAVSDDRVGEFGVFRRCTPSAIATATDRLAVATDEDVLLADGQEFRPTGYGPAVAVGFGDNLWAGSPNGRIAGFDGHGWTDVGTLDAEIRAIEGNLVATDGGVYRIDAGLTHAGLVDVNDVASDGLPLAATSTGLYTLGNGWMEAASGEFRAVDTDGERAHAATREAAFARGDTGWTGIDLPTDTPPIGFAYGSAVFGVTANGTLLIESGEGFRAHELGLSAVVGLAVPG